MEHPVQNTEPVNSTGSGYADGLMDVPLIAIHCSHFLFLASHLQGKQKTKRKKVVEGEIVVMGTVVGSVLFYEVTKAALVSQHKEAHAGRVTGLSWSSTTLALFSCGEDGFILEWDPESTKITR